MGVIFVGASLFDCNVDPVDMLAALAPVEAACWRPGR